MCQMLHRERLGFSHAAPLRQRVHRSFERFLETLRRAASTLPGGAKRVEFKCRAGRIQVSPYRPRHSGLASDVADEAQPALPRRGPRVLAQGAGSGMDGDDVVSAVADDEVAEQGVGVLLDAVNGH